MGPKWHLGKWNQILKPGTPARKNLRHTHLNFRLLQALLQLLPAQAPHHVFPTRAAVPEERHRLGGDVLWVRQERGVRQDQVEPGKKKRITSDLTENKQKLWPTSTWQPVFFVLLDVSFVWKRKKQEDEGPPQPDETAKPGRKKEDRKRDEGPTWNPDETSDV